MSGGNTGLWSGILMIQDNYQLITAICKNSLDNRHSDLQINLKGRTGNCPLTGGKLTSCTTFILCPKKCLCALSVPRDAKHSKQVSHVSTFDTWIFCPNEIPHILGTKSGSLG